jgi:hypothetical protein
VPGATREQAFKVGREIAEAVTKANPWHAPLPVCWFISLLQAWGPDSLSLFVFFFFF